MNISEYIHSGILEEYVVGVTSSQETQEVKCMSHIYPEIKTELFKLEDAIGRYTSLYEKTPPAGLKEKIFSRMNFEEASGDEAQENIAETKVVPLWSKISVAAAILIALLAGYQYYDNTLIRENTAQLNVRINELEKRNATDSELLAFYKNPDIRVIKLAGKEISPESAADILWNQKNQEVTLNVLNLPTPAPGNQYQLWTIVDGTPVDMGVVDPQFEGKILKMKASSGNVAAFAITLEKEGGSPVPTLEKMYVMGPV